MKIVLNHCFGCFSVSDAFVKEWNISHSDKPLDHVYDATRFRADPNFIQMVEEMGTEWASGSCAKLTVCCIPDTATDYHVIEYDGAEEIIYVVDGKIHFAVYSPVVIKT